MTRSLLLFAGPMILGNLLQQFYNIVDTWVVGRFVGADALASVGSAYSLMTFLTSILIGLCMGCGALLSYYYGKGDTRRLQNRMHTAFVLIGGISVVLWLLVQCAVDPILVFLRVPAELYGMMRDYVSIVFLGIFFVFLYNFFAFVLRAVGNSVMPLCFLGLAAGMNVGLDLFFVVCLDWGLEGAAWATVFSQVAAGVGLAAYTWVREPGFRFCCGRFLQEEKAVGELLRFSMVTSAQQSVMNFGILMVQGLVNSFGMEVMAAFAAAVKIDTFAYMPAQEFGNAYSIFVSQSFGAGNGKRLREGTRSAFRVSTLFCVLISAGVFLFADNLMRLFVKGEEMQILAIGRQYLRIEGAFYVGIGVLFLLYGYFRGINRPGVSLLLTVVSLGSRVALAYMLAAVPAIGVAGIWWAIPIGWALADGVGLLWMGRLQRGGVTDTGSGPCA